MALTQLGSVRQGCVCVSLFVCVQITNNSETNWCFIPFPLKIDIKGGEQSNKISMLCIGSLINNSLVAFLMKATQISDIIFNYTESRILLA